MALFEVTLTALLDGETRIYVEAEDPEDARDRAIQQALDDPHTPRWESCGLSSWGSVEVEQVMDARERQPDVADRVERAVNLVYRYSSAPDDQESDVIDALTDLAHLCAEARWNFAALVERATRHAAEARRPS